MTTWKINFRCALNGLKDIIERRDLEEPDCRVYQMLPCSSTGREGGRRWRGRGRGEGGSKKRGGREGGSKKGREGEWVKEERWKGGRVKEERWKGGREGRKPS